MQRDFEAINARLNTHREPMSDRILENMVAGYAGIDGLLAAGIDVFAMGHHRHLLELNSLVLCGSDPVRREQYAGHRAATERRFYEQRDGGIRELAEWHAGHRRDSPWLRAAGVFVRVLSQPQLFVEGNHRTGALLMSYILVAAGLPPFVLTPENAAAYFAPSAEVRGIERGTAGALFRIPILARRLAHALATHADRRYLTPAATPAAP